MGLMKITVRLFAGMREAAGCEVVHLEDLSDDARVADVRRALEERFPALQGVVAMPALDLEYVDEAAPVTGGCEVAFIPPVSGG